MPRWPEREQRGRNLTRSETMKRYRQRHFGQPEVRSPRWSEAQRAGRQARRDAEAAERGPLFQRLNTEIDALAALRPEVLSGIVEAAIAPFHDFTLVTRIEMAAEQWRADVNATLQAEPRYAAAHRRVSALRSVLEAAAEALSQAQDEAEADFAEIPTPEFELPEPEIADEAPESLFDSNADWAAATRKLIEYQRWGDGEEPTE